MGDLVPPTDRNLPGPWLLDREALYALDDVLVAEGLRLRADRNGAIDKALEEFLSDRPELHSPDPDTPEAAERQRIRNLIADTWTIGRDSQCVSLYLDGDNRLDAESVREAMMDPAVQRSRVLGLGISLMCGDVELQANVHRSTPDLRVRTSPPAHPAARRLLFAFENWADRHGPTWWQTLWLTFSGVLCLVWALVLGISLWIAGNASAPQRSLKQEAISLLEQGVTDQNLHRGLELLLAAEYDVRVVAVDSPPPRWLFVLFWGGLALCIAISVRPRVVFGIGSGEHRIRWWRLWMNLVAVTIPASLVATLIWPRILEWIAAAVGGR